ncbi:MAG: hypothetical protein J6K58_06070 [Lachnospiraceae bacterium]|nr:hypothetical protein [Lachnospiraceae bacterium]
MFLYTCETDQWGPTKEYNCPAEVSFTNYIKNSEDYNIRDMALIFHGSYEKSGDDRKALEKRENWAEGWYNHFTGVEDIRVCYEKYNY